MSNVYGSNQSPRITSVYMNAVDDPAPGVPLTSPSGSIVSAYTGQMGGIITLDAKSALRLSDTVNQGQLYNGGYQYVRFKAGSTAANARGQIVFWDDLDNFVVTPDVTANNIGKVAGVTLNAVTKGNYGFIQVSGRATVKCKATLTKVAVDGDLMVVDQTPGNTADVLADATNLASPSQRSVLGVALGAPTNGGSSLCLLRIPANAGN